jgi:hypothetical protein
VPVQGGVNVARDPRFAYGLEEYIGFFAFGSGCTHVKRRRVEAVSATAIEHSRCAPPVLAKLFVASRGWTVDDIGHSTRNAARGVLDLEPSVTLRLSMIHLCPEPLGVSLREYFG